MDIRTVALPVTLEVEASGVALTVVDRQVTKASAGYLEPKLTVKVEKVKVVETKLPRSDVSGDLLLVRDKPADVVVQEA